MVGTAAAASAAGDHEAADALLRDATELNRSNPTYYGSALLAVGQLLLDPGQAGRCPPDADEATKEPT
jgi:hypothetical protein